MSMFLIILGGVVGGVVVCFLGYCFGRAHGDRIDMRRNAIERQMVIDALTDKMETNKWPK